MKPRDHILSELLRLKGKVSPLGCPTKGINDLMEFLDHWYVTVKTSSALEFHTKDIASGIGCLIGTWIVNVNITYTVAPISPDHIDSSILQRTHGVAAPRLASHGRTPLRS